MHYCFQGIIYEDNTLQSKEITIVVSCRVLVAQMASAKGKRILCELVLNGNFIRFRKMECEYFGHHGATQNKILKWRLFVYTR